MLSESGSLAEEEPSELWSDVESENDDGAVGATINKIKSLIATAQCHTPEGRVLKSVCVSGKLETEYPKSAIWRINTRMQGRPVE